MTILQAACVIGTVIYYSPLDPYFEVPCFGILVPTFIIGYLIIVSSDILVLFTYEDYIFLVSKWNVCDTLMKSEISVDYLSNKRSPGIIIRLLLVMGH